MEEKNLKEVVAGVTSRAKLEDLVKKGISEVSPEELADAYTTAENIKLVRFHASEKPINLVIGGVASLAKDLPPEKKEYFSGGGNSPLVVSGFKDARKRIRAIIESTRRKAKDCCVGNSDLMEAGIFEREFLPHFRQKQEELDEVLRYMIEDCYEEEMARFAENARVVIDTLNPTDKAQVEKRLEYVKNIPVKDVLAGTSMTIETDFTPSQISDEDLREVLNASKKEYVIREAMNMIHGMLVDLWEALLRYWQAVNRFADGSTNSFSKAKPAFVETVKKIKRENIKTIPFIDSLCDACLDLSRLDIPDDIEVDIIPILSIIYGEIVLKAGENLPMSRKPEWLTEETLVETYSSM